MSRETVIMVPSRFSMCLRDPKNRPWYVQVDCFLARVHGIDLAFHHRVKSIIELSLDPTHWQASDPLTGCLMFDSKPGEARDDFRMELDYHTIPKLEAATKRPFFELVKTNRENGKPAPHPSTVLIYLSV